MNIRQPVALFLFPHQDDEFGVFYKILAKQKEGCRICCAYITTGTSDKISSERRNKESLRVLSKLGVLKENIFFAGEELAIYDKTLIDNFDVAKNWIAEWILSFSLVDSIFIPAWEGGHPDHDALHAITVKLSEKIGLLNRVWQFPLYNSYKCIGPFFRVFEPLPWNGKTLKTNIPWACRFIFIQCCLSYPSQIKTWIGLFPFVFWKYLFNGQQITQAVSLKRLEQRPHIGRLYYEKRKFCSWKKLSAHII